ncbi:MAG: c-type cytochrome [Opitutaceae bacterium]|nr:c-type cytochrome [Opitutaceae bacterium]
MLCPSRARAFVVAALALLAVAACRAADKGRAPAGADEPPALTLARQLLAQADADGDGRIGPAERAAIAPLWFARLDADGAARVSREEFLLRFDGIIAPRFDSPRRYNRAAAASNALGLFELADRDRDAALDRAELDQALAGWFAAWDADGDGGLTAAELSRGLLAMLPPTNFGTGAVPEKQEPRADLPAPPPAPVLSPAESLATIRVPDGFRVELAASEPMIEEPVALSFDEDGRAYVVEMRAFMRDIAGSRERDPIGRISQLEDTDGDGRFDRATVFLDGLILPRAVAAVAGGILHVSDYQLHYARDTDGDGRADLNEVIDPNYGRGSVEHAPSGLFPAMDNWIYNGASTVRYRVIGRTLVRQETERRGQWGMTQDNFGRLIYNVNNSQLLGDFAPPNQMGRNPHHPTTAGLNLTIATNQRVFPARMNTAINRGYATGVLDAAGRALVFASSCGPVVYRGENFPAEFQGNAFVADPALNLIKRNIVADGHLTLTSRFAYDDREFLTSTDERFRPVSLYNGPDGALWIVDLYRGVAQYGAFMTPYLRRESVARGLDQGISRGRLYRVVATEQKPAAFPRLSHETTAELVERLAHPNGWIRDTAQRLIIERGDRSVAPALATLAAIAPRPETRVQALWTLEGLFAELPAATVGEAGLKLLAVGADFRPTFSPPSNVAGACLGRFADAHPKVQVAALRVAEHLVTELGQLQLEIDYFPQREPVPETLFQAVLTAGNQPKPASLPLLAQLATRGAADFLIREGVLSGLRGAELAFTRRLVAEPEWRERAPGRAALLHALAAAVARANHPTDLPALRDLAAKLGPENDWRRRAIAAGIASVPPPAAVATAAARPLTANERMQVAAGATHYQQVCAGCHGLDGRGVVPLAPPLAGSEWVTGPESRLLRVMLHGLTGPVQVGETQYAPPAVLPEMAGLAALPDEQLAAIASYVRRAWGHGAEPVTPQRVALEREASAGRVSPWLAIELESAR